MTVNLSQFASHAGGPAWLEALMLLCFGLAWPFGNLRMLRTRRALGPGLAVTALILCGYVAGALAKWVAAAPGSPVPALFWFYLVNAFSVALNLVLQLHYGRRDGEPRASRELTKLPRLY